MASHKKCPCRMTTRTKAEDCTWSENIEESKILSGNKLLLQEDGNILKRKQRSRYFERQILRNTGQRKLLDDSTKSCILMFFSPPFGHDSSL